jgi:hypothetical protein
MSHPLQRCFSPCGRFGEFSAMPRSHYNLIFGKLRNDRQALRCPRSVVPGLSDTLPDIVKSKHTPSWVRTGVCAAVGTEFASKRSIYLAKMPHVPCWATWKATVPASGGSVAVAACTVTSETLSAVHSPFSFKHITVRLGGVQAG